MSRLRRVFLGFAVPLSLALALIPAVAQEPAPDATADPAPEGDAAADPAAEAEAGADDADDAQTIGVLRYARGDYRDPFRSLEERQKPIEEEARPPGPAGMLIEEIDLVGVLAGPKGIMVLIIGPDGLGYSLTEGADLYDGKVLRIDPSQGLVVFRQEVNDPNRIKPYRDVERRLDSAS